MFYFLVEINCKSILLVDRFYLLDFLVQLSVLLSLSYLDHITLYNMERVVGVTQTLMIMHMFD